MRSGKEIQTESITLSHAGMHITVSGWLIHKACAVCTARSTKARDESQLAEIHYILKYQLSSGLHYGNCQKE